MHYLQKMKLQPLLMHNGYENFVKLQLSSLEGYEGNAVEVFKR